MLHDDAKTNRSTPAVRASSGEPDAGLVVDRVGELLVELAERVVRQRGQVHDRVDPVEVAPLHVADIAGDSGAGGGGQRSEVAPVVEDGVEADHVVARRLEHAASDRADVAAAPGQEYAHTTHPTRGGRH